MFWIVFFSLCIAQGLFLISVVLYKSSRNPLASYLIGCILFLMVLSNLSYLVIRTDLLQYVPQMYGISWGILSLFGPLFYFYSKSILDVTFHWSGKCWLHFTPYLIQLVMIVPYFFDHKESWIIFIDQFLSGNLKISLYTKIVFGIQSAHLFIYLLVTFRWIEEKGGYHDIRYLIPTSSRINWLNALTYCLTVLLLTVIALYLFILVNGTFDPVTNYIYTAVTSGIIYFMAYTFVLSPEVVNPDFTQKYRAYMTFNNDDGEKYLLKLKLLLDEQKIYTNPELKLSALANKLGLPQHQVSKLINERFGKSFTDLINEYRVKEFISRMNSPKYESHSILGIAFDTGFNSKSSFNSAFKKITGKTPSEFKKHDKIIVF